MYVCTCERVCACVRICVCMCASAHVCMCSPDLQNHKKYMVLLYMPPNTGICVSSEDLNGGLARTHPHHRQTSPAVRRLPSCPRHVHISPSDRAGLVNTDSDHPSISRIDACHNSTRPPPSRKKLVVVCGSEKTAQRRRLSHRVVSETRRVVLIHLAVVQSSGDSLKRIARRW